MFTILSISKWDVNTKHYYGKLYSGAGSYIDLRQLYKGEFNNYKFKEYFDECKYVKLFKTETEKEMLKQTVNVVKDSCGYNPFIIVFYQGNYSLSRSSYIQDF